MDKSDSHKPDLSVIFGIGKPSKGDDKSPSSRDSRDERDDKDESDELPPGFEEAAIEAFPDLEGDTDRLKALERCIKACTDSY